MQSECATFQILKGGDDGLTNHVAAQLEVYASGANSCRTVKGCTVVDVVIASNVTPLGDKSSNLISVPIEIYERNGEDRVLKKAFDVECDVFLYDCAPKVFARLI